MWEVTSSRGRTPFPLERCLTIEVLHGAGGDTTFEVQSNPIEDINFAAVNLSSVTGDATVACVGANQDESGNGYLYFASPVFASITFAGGPSPITAASDGAVPCSQTILIPG